MVMVLQQVVLDCNVFDCCGGLHTANDDRHHSPSPMPQRPVLAPTSTYTHVQHYY
jgi:hypothetical protein